MFIPPWTGTNTRTTLALIYFHWYKGHYIPFLVMFPLTPAVMFNKRFSTHLLSAYVRIYACASRKEARDSPLHIQAISGLRTHRPFKQPPASFPQSFTLSFLLQWPAFDIEHQSQTSKHLWHLCQHRVKHLKEWVVLPWWRWMSGLIHREMLM